MAHRTRLAVLLASAMLLGLAPSAAAACRKCEAAIRTLAYTVSGCRSDAAGLVGRQALQIRRGRRDPVTAFEVVGTEPLPDPVQLCRRFGDSRYGSGSVVAGVVQRLGVSPDGTGVVFEITGRFALLPLTELPPEQEGIFYVRSDGRGLRRLGPASREAAFRFVLNPLAPGGFSSFIAPRMAFSRDGRTVGFTDLGPGPAGEEAVQIVTLDIATGERTQLTHLPPGSAPDPSTFVTFPPIFIDDHTIGFQTYTDPDGSNPERGLVAFTVKIDGSRLRAVPSPVAVAGSRVVPSFRTTGTGNVLSLAVPGTPVRSFPEFLTLPITEIFLREGRNLLQLTNFRRVETYAGFLSTDRRRVFFEASADPLETNPTENCQLFTIDPLGAHLRQLTHFSQEERSQGGCFFEPPPGCALGQAFQDPVTRTVVFDSSCDPFGTHRDGEQIFAMRADGSRLRQLTDTHGLAIAADGTVTVELPGPWAYSAE